ncbi:BppU family phage baseplate upper protein [Staphylococcus pettenkoferi]|uniref:BppU family phage baseplate upper protein n=1 Tax=Staphylococcus pettenkoferi TaxID=170573 RepID=UPI0025564FE0|nr:BppU family phage baseplate upper protein [Staphylococcus pettenkoferi]MDK7284395.1 BppU family phage baseplate upper protein [Staphylococcus pettenkoferi]
MELNKIAKYQAKNEPYLKPISDLGIGFYNLDENTATLQFQIYNDNGPLLISNENVEVHGYFESSNGSVSTVDKLNVVDGMNGIAQITLDKDFLQASTSTQVTGQIYVAANNVTDNPNNNQTAVLGEFTFQVADALINKVSSFTKVEYIRMFDQLREEIKQRTKEMEDDIGDIKTLVSEVENAVADGKADITKIKNDSISELEDIANTTNASVRQQASQAISDIQSIVDEYTTKLNDETEEKINEVNEASDKVLESIKQNNVVTTEETENWQKYKLTEDDGTIKYYSKGTIEDVTQLPAGLYETVSDDDATDQGIPLDNSYVQIKVWEAGRGRKEIELTSTFNSEKYFRLIHTDGTKDSGWQKIGNNQSDTGWLPLRLKNGYKKSSTPDFEPSYRVIDNGDFKQVYVRLGVENLANEKNVVATIPSEFVPNKIYSLGVSTTYKTPPKVIISGGDIEFHPYNGDSYNSTDYIIYQDNWII